MAIQRWDPLRDVLRMQQGVNKMFEDVLSRSSSVSGRPAGGARVWQPPVDLLEESERYVLRADLPGVLPGDVEVRVEDGKLTLRGERRNDGETHGDSYLRVERPSGRFDAQIALPDSVDAQRIEASQRNGVLEVSLPKRREPGLGRVKVTG